MNSTENSTKSDFSSARPASSHSLQISRMAVTFQSALDSLSVMFPAWDKDTLGSLLISNQGRVEVTIEAILAMEGSASGPASPQAQVQNSAPVSNSVDLLDLEGTDDTVSPLMKGLHNTNPQTQPPRPQTTTHKPKVAQSVAPTKPKRNVRPGYRGTTCHLPHDFLTLPGKQPSSSDRILADEELALILQNELFQKELVDRGYNPFYGGTAYSNPTTDPPSHVTNSNRSAFWDTTYINAPPGTPIPPPVLVPDMGIVKSLSTMGEAAKRNLSNLATRFVANMNQQQQPHGGRAEMQPLVGDDDDEDEVISFEDTSTSNGRGHFLNEGERKKDYSWTENPSIQMTNQSRK